MRRIERIKKQIRTDLKISDIRFLTFNQAFIWFHSKYPDIENFMADPSKHGTECFNQFYEVIDSYQPIRSEMTPEHKAKISAALQGRIAWNKGIPCDSTTKEKMSQAKIGKVFTDEHKHNMSIASIKKWQERKGL